ncbi:uncharacterized protein EAF02_009450 [Botrytis sinoallii]|uniref:uncharacterized protein n=1 Tax=Botrytis sinoallii TaxID=1463999 RepID=UPI0019013501|nr:uncharacterized protein EAF02_009450 [Botrytis sinoallii]KAF7868714.1 hypothetical protein EAF02_009450 [Botrytis sinoallii]
MSGFEIAGIVLGGFPILIIAVESFDETFKRVTIWRQFRICFLQFIDAIDVEEQLFNELLRRFLLSVDVPRDEVHLFLEDRSYEGWHREELIAIFHLRLGKPGVLRRLQKLDQDSRFTLDRARSILDSILPASPQQLSVAENVRQKLHRNIESKPNSTSNTRASQVKKSGSSDSPSSSIQASSTVLNEIEIHNLCETVYNFDITYNSYLGYLPADHLERHEFRDSDDNVTSRAFYRDKFVSLETILSKPDKFSPLNRYERYKVAYILASPLLQLQNAPWLTGNLQKRHILFPCDWNKHKVLIDQPHFSHSFLSTKYQYTPPGQIPNLKSSTATIKKSLNDLDIVLLELCFGQRIEEQSIRQDFLVDGKEHASTNHLTALEWADAVYEEEPASGHVIKYCRFFIFDGKADWDNLSFTQAVYASVVEPLEKIVDSWPNAS